MKWTKLFKTTEQKNEEYRGNDYIEPWISLTEDSTKVAFNKRDINLVSPSVKRTYDGNALTANNIKVVGFWEDGDGATYNVTGIQTLVGTQPNSFEYTLSNETSENDYHITKTVGTLEVTDGTGPGETPVEPSLVITSAPTSSDYGQGDTVTFSIQVTNIYDTAKNITIQTIEGCYLAHGSFSNVNSGSSVTETATHTITEADILNGGYVASFTAIVGNLSIVSTCTATTVAPQKRQLIITAASDEKPYDGAALTNEDWELDGDELKDGDEIEYVVVNGTQTLVGSSENVPYDCTFSTGTNPEDYEITYVNGTLTVTDEDVAEMAPELVVTIAEPSSKCSVGETVSLGFTVTNIYDQESTLYLTTGDDQTIVGYVPSSLSAGEILEGTISHTMTQSDKANGDFTFSLTAEVNGVDYEAVSSVEFKRTVTMTSASDSRSFDGTHLTNDEITISGDGFAPGEGASYYVTGTQYFVGSSENEFTYTLNEDTSASDYVIVTQFGTLTVTDEDVEPDLVLTSVFEDDEYSLGDVVTITFSATNIYDHAETISLSDNSGEITLSQSVYANAAAGYRFTTTGTHEITEADIAAGGFNGTVACYVGNIAPETEINITTEMPDPHLELSITTTSSSQDPDGYAENEEIEYEVNIENRGNLTISNIVISCSLDNLEWTIDSLVPEETSGWTFSHIVDSDDVANETVVCEITGNGDNDSGEPTIVDPAEIEDATIQS